MRRARELPPVASLLASLAALGLAAAIAGLATFASFASSTSAGHSDSTGTVAIALGANGGPTNRLSVNATEMRPGDTIERSFDLGNSGDQDLASVQLTTSASPSSALDTDATNGLQMAIDRCSVDWTESGASPAFSYTCGGSTSTVLASRPVIGSNLTLSNLGALTAGATDHLRLRMTAPSGQSDSFQGLSSTITYAFTGTQRAATSK